MVKTSRAFVIFAAAVFILTLSSCTRKYAITPGSATPTPVTSNSTIYTPVQADNLLSSNLYNFYQSQTGNIFFSPFSIITAMAMAQEGANGPTATQMQTVLNLNPDATTRLQGFQQLINEINSPSKPYTLATADNMWIQEGFNVLTSYISTLQTYYEAGVTNVDFVGNPTAALQTINGAVSQETYGFIPNLLAPSNIKPTTRVILTNAIYFEADWQYQFAPSSTNPATFNLSSTATESVSMMHEKLSAVIGNYNGAASVIALPYKDNGASMYIFLPPLGGMPALENALTGANINSWLAANSAAMTGTAGVTQVDLSLPKFTFKTNYDLTNTFIQLGMPLPFTIGQADFSGIDGFTDLYISAVVHQAYVDVNESGTTAAASTAVVVSTSAYIPGTPFTVNSPFIFIIVDNATNTVLFMGRVNDPLSTT